MCFHPGAKWLKEHGNDPIKENCVEVYNFRGKAFK